MSSSGQIAKLMHKLDDFGVDTLLVTAGLTSPKLIRAASDQELEGAVGSQNVAAVNSAFDRTPDA